MLRASDSSRHLPTERTFISISLPSLMSRPGHRALPRWLGSIFSECGSLVGLASTQSSKLQFLFSSRGPIPVHRAVDIQKWAVYALCSLKIWGCRILRSARILRRFRAPHPELLLSPPFISQFTFLLPATRLDSRQTISAAI